MQMRQQLRQAFSLQPWGRVGSSGVALTSIHILVRILYIPFDCARRLVARSFSKGSRSAFVPGDERCLHKLRTTANSYFGDRKCVYSSGQRPRC